MSVVGLDTLIPGPRLRDADGLRRPLVLVAALGRGRAIGREGALPWHLPEDLKHFKDSTLGHAIVMGRRTFESIGRPLPWRENLVVSRSWAGRPPSEQIEGIRVFPSFEEALVAAWQRDEAPRVIGGGEIYALALPLATELLLTEIDREVEGADTFFPEIDLNEWVEVARSAGQTPGVHFRTLVRRGRAEG